MEAVVLSVKVKLSPLTAPVAEAEKAGLAVHRCAGRWLPSR